jgi:hypothetical protein
MRIPGFAGEAALYSSSGHYRSVWTGPSRSGAVRPQQGSLPPGCRRVFSIDEACVQECRARGGRPAACRRGCTTETIECDTFPPLGT